MDKVDLDFIIKDLCDVFGIKPNVFFSRDKSDLLSVYRQIYCYITTYLGRDRVGVNETARAMNKHHSLIKKQRMVVMDLLYVKDSRFMKVLEIYHTKSKAYSVIKQYYQSINKSMDYGEIFYTYHCSRTE